MKNVQNILDFRKLGASAKKFDDLIIFHFMGGLLSKGSNGGKLGGVIPDNRSKHDSIIFPNHQIVTRFFVAKNACLRAIFSEVTHATKIPNVQV